jgi:hypothetical protein
MPEAVAVSRETEAKIKGMVSPGGHVGRGAVQVPPSETAIQAQAKATTERVVA